MTWTTLDVIFVIFYSDVTFGWVNDMEGLLRFECPKAQHLSRLESKYSSSHYDRQWIFKCKEGFVSETCHWSDRDTLYDRPFDFTCKNGLLAGLSSKYSPKKGDRSWLFKCCSLITKDGVNCRETDYINDFHSEMKFAVEDPSEAIRGIGSFHSNDREDRRWKFRLCEYSMCKAVHMEVISKIEEPQESGSKVVGIVTSQGCSPGISYTIGLDQQTGMEETISISDTQEHSFAWEMSISVGFTMGMSIEFITEESNFEMTWSSSYGYTYSKTISHDESESFSAGSSQQLEYPGPGAALIIAHCKQYELGQKDIDVEYTLECDNGNIYKEQPKVHLKANTYGQTHYMQKHATFPKGSCSATSEACIIEIQGKYALSPEEIIRDFEDCVKAVNGTVN